MRHKRTARPTLESLEGRHLRSGVIAPPPAGNAAAYVDSDDYHTPFTAFQGGCNANGDRASKGIIAILIG